MDNLKKKILECESCPLVKTKNHVIFGEGNYQAKIVLVGEAPGANEDKIGRPFIGKSGQLLDNILAACGFTREQHVFITNIIRCRPPGNRPPTEIEVQACRPYLYQQVDLIDPKIVILLGATALKRYMDDNSLKITRLRGTWMKHKERLVMPVYHPSALLRNPHLKKDTWKDFKKVVVKYRELVDPDHHSDHI